MTDRSDNIVIAEQKKRDRMIDPVRRWQMIQETIEWAEQQLPVRRNTPSACKANERKILQSMRNESKSTPPAKS